MKIVAFTGMPFSGKSEAVALAKKRNYYVIRMGDLVWAETKKQKPTITDQSVGEIATAMRKKYGMDIWAKKTIKQIKSNADTRIVIIDGVRNIEEVARFKDELSTDFLLVAIKVPDQIRYDRALQRNRVDDGATLEEIKKRDEREIGWGLHIVIQQADTNIDNSKDIETFRQQIENLFDNLEKR